ncbi:MAG TPA: hypothetical protein PKH77_15150 [Anaerolineae bacterium]|nr:hypothetical protein [Anaerolineae bacterium]
MNVKNSHLGMYIIILALLAACAVTPSPASLPTATMVSPTATDTPSPSVTPTLSPKVTTTLEPDYLSAMVCDTEGNLWIGGLGGVLKFDPATEAIVAYPLDKYAPNLQVPSLLVTQEETVWAVGMERFQAWKLFRLDGETWSKQENIDNTRPIWLVAEGTEGTLWVGSDFGTYYYDGGIWHQYGYWEDVPLMKTFARTSNGTWWGTYTCCMMTSFFQFDGNTWTHDRPGLVLDDFVSRIATAPDGSLWFKGGYHLYHYDTNLVWTPYTHTVGNGDWIRTLTIASNSDVWIGTDEGQIQRFQDEVWYDIRQYPNRSIEALDSAPDGTVWAGTSDDCIIQFDRDGATGKSYRVRQLDVFPDSTCSN